MDLNLILGLFKEIRFRINITKTKCQHANMSAVAAMKEISSVLSEFSLINFREVISALEKGGDQ